MARDTGFTGGIADIILYGGIVYIGYKVLTGWNIITSNTEKLSWNPLSEQQISRLKTEPLGINYNSMFDGFDNRTGRGRLRGYGFASEQEKPTNIYGMK